MGQPLMLLKVTLGTTVLRMVLPSESEDDAEGYVGAVQNIMEVIACLDEISVHVAIAQLDPERTPFHPPVPSEISCACVSRIRKIGKSFERNSPEQERNRFDI